MTKLIYFELPIMHPKYKRLYGWWHRMREHANPVRLEDRSEKYKEKDITICKAWYYNFSSFADYCLSIGYTNDKYIHLKEGCTEFGPGNIELKDYRYCPRIKYAEFDGVTKSAYAWCKEFGLSYTRVVYHIERGKSAKEAIEHVKSQKKTGSIAGCNDKCSNQ